MRIVFQRVHRACVRVDGETVGVIGTGALLLLGIAPEDTEEDAALLAQKAASLRIFEDEQGRMNRSLLDIGGGTLVVSNFTLYGNCRRGRRPDFSGAAAPAHAQPLYERFAALLTACGVTEVATGRFGADMQIDMEADGPVTLLLDSRELKAPRRAKEVTA